VRQDAPRARRRPQASRGAGGLTARAAALALVVCILSLSLAYPLREYLSQRHDIAALETRVAEQQADVAAAKDSYARWQDPAYIRAQAKARLHMVDPGERQYVVVESPTRPGATAPSETPPATAPGESNAQPHAEAWFGSLLSSLHEADGAAAPAK
jgi:cell division protein FtsB